MPKESNIEMKVGLFVVLAILCLSIFVFSLSDFSLFQKGSQYTATFHFANGLKKSAPVRFAGVDAGLVKDIRVISDEMKKTSTVEVDMFLDEGVAVPNDSQVFINQLGLLGEKYVEIMPGSSESYLSQGEKISGDDPIAMEHLSRTINDLATKFEVTVDKVNNGVLSDTNQKALQNTLTDLSAIVRHIKEGKGTVGSLLINKSLYDNLDEFTRDLKENPWKLFYRPKQRDKK